MNIKTHLLQKECCDEKKPYKSLNLAGLRESWTVSLNEKNEQTLPKWKVGEWVKGKYYTFISRGNISVKIPGINLLILEAWRKWGGWHDMKWKRSRGS